MPALQAIALKARDYARSKEKSQPLTLAIFCRAGEIRSVGFAYIVEMLLRRDGWVGRCQHLSEWFWRWHTCQKHECHTCQESDASRKVLSHAMDVWLELKQRLTH